MKRLPFVVLSAIAVLIGCLVFVYWMNYEDKSTTSIAWMDKAEHLVSLHLSDPKFSNVSKLDMENYVSVGGFADSKRWMVIFEKTSGDPVYMNIDSKVIVDDMEPLP